MKTVFAVDIGTTSLKAGLITAQGEAVFICNVPYTAPANRFVAEGWLWALKSAADKLKAANLSDVEIAGIAVSGNGPTLVNEAGFTLPWKENEGSFVSETTGHSLFIPRLLLIKTMMSEVYEDSQVFFSGPEYLVYQLTGNAITVLPEERFEQAYWTEDLLEKNQIDEGKLLPFVALGCNCGFLREELLEFLGLPQVPVFACGPDFIAALVGTGTVEAGTVCDRCGSSEGINLCVSKEIYAEGIRTLPSVTPGLWNLSVLIPESGNLPQEERLDRFSKALTLLKETCEKNGLSLPSQMTATGGQLKDDAFVEKKRTLLKESFNITLVIPACHDSELVGDAKLAFEGLES